MVSRALDSVPISKKELMGLAASNVYQLRKMAKARQKARQKTRRARID